MKQKKSILDPFAERLTQWFQPVEAGGDGLTLAQAQAQLLLDGCRISQGRLSQWWSARQKRDADARFFASLADGSRMARQVKEAFVKTPPPEISTLIGVVQSLIMTLQVKGQANPKYLEMADRLLASVLEFARMQTAAGQEKLKIEIRQAAEARAEKQLQLAREKFRRDSCELFLKWHADKTATATAGSNLSHADKIEKLGQTMFGEDWN